MKKSPYLPPQRLLLTSLIGLGTVVSQAASITWTAPSYFSADTDVLSAGTFSYAYDWANSSQVVNGVTFTGSNSTTAGGANVSLAGFTGNTTNAYTTTSAPFSTLSAAYRAMLIGGNYTGATTATITLNNLTPGRTYAVQYWVGDPRSGSTTTRTGVLNGVGFLDFNSTNAVGGVGQFAIGRFTADAATQAFTFLGDASSQMNALQVRDISGLGQWVGSAGASWDASATANFSTNIPGNALATGSSDAAKAAADGLNFGDTYFNGGLAVAVTQNTVTVASGGVVGGSVTFANSALNYTLGSSDSTGLTGASSLSKSGSGTLTLSGTHTYTGATSVNQGTLKLGSSSALPNTPLIVLGTLDLNGFDATVKNTSGLTTGVVTDNSAGSGTSVLTLSQGLDANLTKFLDGASHKVGLRVINSNSGFLLTNASNNFSGGITLAHSASGTRMAPGTITAGAYGTGPITVGESATDKAGIFFAAANQTLTNPVIANTGEGTDRVGTFRIAAANITFAGQLTANLAPVTFSTNESGSALVTGKITGSNGLTLRSHTLGGTTLTVTLNNAANDYAGDTVINLNPQSARSYTLTLGAADQIPNGAGKGNVTVNTNGTGVGTLQLAGFSETINGLSGNGTVTSSSGTPTLTVGDNDVSSSFSGILAGSLSLVKNGAGTQTLSGTSSFSGATTVTAGNLAVTGNLGSSAVTVNSGATLSGSGSVASVTVNTGGIVRNDSGTLTASNLSLASGSTVSVGSLSNYVATPAVNVATSSGLSASGPVTLSVNSVAGAQVGPVYKLVGYSGTLGGGFSSFNLAPLPGRAAGTLVNNAGEIGLQLSGIDSLRWTAATDNVWNTSTSNWQLVSNSSPTAFISGDNLAFDDSAANPTVNISAANVSPASASFANVSSTYTVQGAFGIAGVAILSKSGAGTLNLNTANTFSGGVQLSQGLLNLGSATALGSGPLTATGGALDNATGSALTIANTVNLNGGLAFVGSNPFTTGAVTLTSDSSLNVQASTLATGAISGSFGLTKSGSGTLVIGAASTYTGATIIAAGTLRIGNNSSLGSNAAGTTVAAGATLDVGIPGAGVNSVNLGTEVVTISGNGVGGSGAIVNNTGIDQYNSLGRMVMAGDASVGGTGRWDLRSSTPTLDMGGFTLTKTGANQISLVGATVSNPGHIVVNQGSFGIETTTNAGGSSANTITLNNGTTLVAYGNTVALAWTINLNGGTISNKNGTGTYAGPVVLGAAGGTLGGVGSATSFDGVISGVGALTKNTTETVNLNATNTYTGGTIVTLGTLNLGHLTDTLANAAPVAINGGILGLGANSDTVGALTLASGSITGSGVLTASSFAVESGAVSPVLAGTGGLTKTTAGSVTLTGANTYTGNTTVEAGTLSVNGANFADSSTVSVATGAVLTLNFAGTDTVASLVLAGVVKAPGVYDAANTGGLITGTGSITVPVTGPSLGSFNSANFDSEELGDTLISGPSADPDRDGVSNVLEYAFAMNPKVPSRGRLPVSNTVLDTGSTYVGCVYTRVKDATDLTFTAEFSSSPDSSLFSASGLTLINIVDNLDGTETVTLRDNTPVTPGNKRFVRILVTYP